MNTDRDNRQATAADVWTWRTQGCSRHEVATYLGIDCAIVRGLERLGQIDPAEAQRQIAEATEKYRAMQ